MIYAIYNLYDNNPECYKDFTSILLKVPEKHYQDIQKEEERQFELTLYNMVSVLAGSRRKKLSGIEGVFLRNLGCLMT